VTADKAAYAVLKIKNVSLNNTAVELSVNGSDKAVTALLEDGNDWQYVVFKLSDANLAGELTALRIDWEKAANEAGNTAYLADIFFVSTEEQADALAKGQYIFPVQPVIEPETEAPTEEATDPETTPEENTEATTTETEAPTGGCRSALNEGTVWILVLCGLGIGVKALLAAAVNLKKEKN
jgi:hypothetical protein